MANVKNFGLIGVGGDVQFAKAGPRIIQNAGTFQLRNATNAADVALTAAGITSSAGNVTLTTGNLVLSSTAGTLSVGGDTTLSRSIAGVFQFNGTAAVVAPVGTTAQRPSAATGMVRVNNDVPAASLMEYYNGTAWTTLATGGTAVTSVSGTQDRITSTGGTTPTIDIAATYVGQSSITTLGTVTTGTWNAGVISPEYGGTGVANGAGDTITLGGAVSTGGTLTTGGNFTTVGADAISITAATGGSTVTLPASGTLLSTGDTTNYVSSIAGEAGRIVVSGSTGAVTVDLDTVGTAVTGQFVKITTDTFGRVTATTAVVTSDITALVDGTYVNVDGDTMTGTLTMSGAAQIVLPNAPTLGTHAANKDYVDSIAAGLSWKDPVQAATTAALTATYDNGTAGIGATLTNSGTQAAFAIDGVTLLVGQRVLIKDQAAAAQNGIYSVTTVGTGSTNWVLTRTVPLDQAGEFYGAAVLVTNGTVNDNTGWTQTEVVTTVGTDPNNWIQFSGANTYTWGVGLVESGNTINVNMGAGIVALPSDEVGIDLYDSANNPLILTLNGTSRDTTTGAALDLLLDGTSLSKSATGLRVAAGGVNLTTMVTGVLPGTNGGTGVNNGANTITLGGNLVTSGANSLTLTTTGATNVTFPTSGTLATVGGTVASFSGGSTGLLPNTATTGAVTLTGTLVVANGGTGATSFAATSLLIGDGTNPVTTDALLTFVTATNTLTVGTATIAGTDGGDVTITATATNGDINLVPNGTGAVVIGPAGAGVIAADAGQTLTVTGNNTLVLSSTSGDIVMTLAAGVTDKVTVAGPSAVQYATGLANEDLVNKYYVDTVAGSAAGDVKAVKATFSLASNGTFNIGSALPVGATILSVKANVTAADTGTGTLSVGKAGLVAAYMTTGESDTQTAGIYISETMVTEAASEQVIGTVAGGSAGAGSVTVVVTYQLA